MNPAVQPIPAQPERRASSRPVVGFFHHRSKPALGAPGALIFPLLLLVFLAAKSFAAGQIVYDAPKAAALGQELITQLRALKPETSFTNTGTLFIKAKHQPLVKVAYTCRVEVTATNWTSYYSARQGTNALAGFSVEHRAGQPSVYRDDAGRVLSGDELNVSFAGSDFWRSDLGLEFFQWPAQRVPKWERARSCGCKVLESTNPAPSAPGYSRVLAWIHDESLGIVQAEAYDTRGKLLKEFRPTELQKVNGRQELSEMEIENVQTRSTTRLEFDL
jgi:hypothetical protein